MHLGTERLDADVVQVVRLVDGRPRVRLGEVQQHGLARLPPHLGRQLREAVRDRPAPVVAQQPQSRPRDGAQRVPAVVGAQLVLAVAEEREVVVGEPPQQGGRLVPVLLVEARRVRVHGVGDGQRLLPHRRPVLDGGRHVADDGGGHGPVRPAPRRRSAGRPPGGRTTRPPTPTPESCRRRRRRAAPSRRTGMTGCTVRCRPRPCRMTSVVTESTTNGMSSDTMSTTVCGEPNRAPRSPVSTPAPAGSRRSVLREGQVRHRGAVQVVHVPRRESSPRHAR